MGAQYWGRIPMGRGGAPWITMRTTRTVLAVVHTITALNRFADVLSVFDSDRRVQLVFTFPDASLVPGNVEHDLIEQGTLVVPWEQAISTRFDLAISVHNSGDLHRIAAPLVILPHGMGYTKLRKTGKPENRRPVPCTGSLRSG